VQTRAALGEHAEMTLAVSAASSTIGSFTTTWRGRALRTIGRDRTGPTLADVLRERGYSPVTVPSHRNFTPGTAVVDGFDVIAPPGFDALRGTIVRHGGLVPAATALETALRAATETSGPLFLWVHLMETHDPYTWPGGHGPLSLDGQRHAVRELDPVVAVFLRNFRAARRRPAVVAVFGDHGEAHGEHGSRFHASSVYAEQVRVALLVAGPGIPSTRVDAPVALPSMPRTFAELLGVALPPAFTEASALSCIRGEGSCPSVVASELPAAGLVSYTGPRYRLVRDVFRRTDRLYEHAVDPLEQRDLTDDAAALGTMRALAHVWDEAH
jgi:arylsulfatase A-like enzyme